eukprot:12946861-Alexandrium_andersonii.AAC.1
MPGHGLADCRVLRTLRLLGGAPPTWAPPEKCLRRAPPGCFAVTIGFSAQNGVESPGRGLGG